MAMPTTVPAVEPASVGRRIFVSYSHLDGDLAAPFFVALQALAGNLPALGIARNAIFYDRDKLKAGDDWDDSIKSSLLRADLFLLLISTRSLTSRYCMDEELAGALRLGIPIVPVLLSPTAAWETRPLTDGRTLGALNAVPIYGKAGVQPISGGKWPNHDLAMQQAMEQIANRLLRDAAAAAAPPAAPPPATAAGRRVLAPLLPNLCNQQRPEDSFEDGLNDWPADKALLVLVKGEFEDDAPGFWERLCHKNLGDWCEMENRVLRPPRPLELPSVYDGAALIADIAPALRRRVSEALFGNARRMRSGADLATLLAADGGLLPLAATLPHEGAAGTAAVLNALLALVDEAPADALLSRLAVAVLVEDPALVAQDRLVAALGLQGRRTHIVETRRLETLSGEHVRAWHRRHQLKDVLRLDEEQLVLRLFKSGAALQHRAFDRQVRPLLGLAAKGGA